MSLNAHNKLKGLAALTLGALVGIPALFSSGSNQLPLTAVDTVPIVPQIPVANRHQTNRFFLEHADTLKAVKGLDYQILIGNVQFRRQDMLMYCDSAHFFDLSNSIEAFGNVRMEQGDTLFVYADELEYSDSTRLAVLYAYPNKKVRLINRDVTLSTDIFNYDLGMELGYYETGGVLTDLNNRLTSLYGEYSPKTSDALFRDRVTLTSQNHKNDTLRIFTDLLQYNTDTHVAELYAPSTIISKDGVIYTDSAVYNTDTEHADLYRRSLVVTSNNNTLTGDTLLYDRRIGYGEAYGNMVITDSAHHVILTGAYGFYNELTDSAFATGRALAKEFSKGDTLYLHGDTIRAFMVVLNDTIGNRGDKVADDIEIVEVEPEDSASVNHDLEVRTDSTHIIIASPHVKFYRSDMQGICDSLTFVQRDSMLHLDKKPIVWSGPRQVFGNVMLVHFNDSTADYAKLPDFGFVAEEIEPDFYHQITGKEILATFLNGELDRVDVSGNVQAIAYPSENDSTVNKMVFLESSFLSAWFDNRDIKRLKTWPETSSVVTPLYLAKRSQLRLKDFKWYPTLRPSSPENVLVIDEEFIAYMNGGDPAAIKPKEIDEPQPMGLSDGELDEEQLEEQSEEQSEK